MLYRHIIIFFSHSFTTLDAFEHDNPLQTISHRTYMLSFLHSFTTQDAFVGFQNDTPATVIFQVTKQLRDELHLHNDKDLAQRKSDVLQSSCNLLLQMATPDALIRLQHTALADQQKMLCWVYCSEQYHESLTQFLQHHINSASEGNGLLIQVSL